LRDADVSSRQGLWQGEQPASKMEQPMPDQIVSFRKKAHVRTIEIEGPPTGDQGGYVLLSSEIAEACERIAWDEEARAVVLAFGDDWVPLLEEDSAFPLALETVPSLVESIAAL